jgi:hypothetical protein
MSALFKAGRVSRTVIKPEAGFRAELPGLDLATLIQMTCARRERLVVRVSSYGEEGYLFSAEGRLVHASVGTLVGDEAVLRMLSWHTGDFALCDRPFPLRPTVESSTEGLLLRAAQRVDEATLERETDSLMFEGLSEELEGRDQDEPEPSRTYAPLPVLKLPTRSAELSTWPLPAARPVPTLASLLQVRAPDELKTIPAPPPRRPPPPPPRSERPSALPPVSLPRPVDTGTPRKSEPPRDDSVLATVRIDARGEVVTGFGSDERLAQLVAYVSRVATLLQADFALDPFDALHAELSGKRVLIYAEAGELVGVVMKPSAAAQALRQRHGV